MIQAVFQMQKEKKLLIQGILFFLAFFGLFTLLDHLNSSYLLMIEEFGVGILLVHISLNLIMSFMSALMFNLSTALFKLTSREGKGSFLTGFAIIFGMVTYGCTPCVVAFLSVIGITLVVTVLPLGGLLYKIIALGILLVGFGILLLEIKYNKCKVKDAPVS